MNNIYQNTDYILPAPSQSLTGRTCLLIVANSYLNEVNELIEIKQVLGSSDIDFLNVLQTYSQLPVEKYLMSLSTSLSP